MNEVFSYFVPQKDDDAKDSKTRLAYASWFIESFPDSEFNKEERIMWFLVAYTVKLGVPLKERYVSTYLDAELKSLMVKNNIKVSGTESLSFDDLSQLQTAVQITKEAMINEYYALVRIDPELDEFIASADAFMSTQLNERMIQLYAAGFDMMSSLQNGRIGSDDALEFTQAETEKLAEIYDKEKLEELSSSTLESEDEFVFMSDFGIPTIDKDSGGIYTTQLFGIDAAPGKGKTRFALGCVAYRAAVFHKKNVCYRSLEQSEIEIKAILLSRHMFHLYDIQVSDKQIREKKIPKEAQAKYESAKIDLFESGRYGKIDIVCKEMYINNFISQLRMRDSLHGPFDLVIIDYMALVDQKQEKNYRMQDDFKVTAKAYKLFKRYLRKTKKCGLAVNQFNAEGTRAANEDKEVGATGTAGGMEAHRSVDYMLSMTSTTAMEAQRKRRLTASKKRGSEGFGSVLVDVRLGISYYYQQTSNLL